MLNTIRAAVEVRWPAAFAVLCPLFDHLALRDQNHELHLLPLLVAPGELACDVGASRGLFTYWLLRAGAKVVAFEPNPHMVEILRRRFARAVARCEARIVPGALGDAAGTATLHVPEGLSPLAALDPRLSEDLSVPVRAVTVELMRLDDCVAEEVALIKLDAEGHELKVLQGAQRILETFRPTILVEAEERHRPGAVASLRALLEPMGAQGFFLEGGKLVPIARFDPERHQPRDALNAAGTFPAKGRAYVNDFVFTSRPEVIARLKAAGVLGEAGATG